ncbi:MAG: hypothetical protein Q9197_004887 [Variospora fuerteventurae]
MYDYLAKVILLGPSGCGKSCLLHRIVKDEWRTLSSQTIGVEFASKIIKVGTGTGRKRIKLQLWDTAGTERFRSVSRSYYRGAAGALLVYDICCRESFVGLPTFLKDARALASPDLIVLLVGNKLDMMSDTPESSSAADLLPPMPSSFSSRHSMIRGDFGGAGGTRRRNGSSSHSSAPYSVGAHQTATLATDEGRQVGQEEATQWASKSSIPVSKEVSAFTGDGVEGLFAQLAQIILTKIELGEIDPDDPLSGIQYGDSGGWADDGSVKSATTVSDVINDLASASLKSQKPELWFPVRYGKQLLYELKGCPPLGLLSETHICDHRSKRLGLWRAEVVQRKLQDVPGTSIYFQINNIPLFSSGSNWIPADSALVWQDILFACGKYPADGDFLDLVRREATVNVKRLRHHPCMVAWVGNHEDYQYQESEHLDYDPQGQDPVRWLKSNFPARYMYEKILADAT